MNKDSDLKQTLKEVKYLLLAWLFFASWVLIYCGFEAYGQDHEDVKITFGMPSWVFWGIALPWICSNPWGPLKPWASMVYAKPTFMYH